MSKLYLQHTISVPFFSSIDGLSVFIYESNEHTLATLSGRVSLMLYAYCRCLLFDRRSVSWKFGMIGLCPSTLHLMFMPLYGRNHFQYSSNNRRVAQTRNIIMHIVFCYINTDLGRVGRNRIACCVLNYISFFRFISSTFCPDA